MEILLSSWITLSVGCIGHVATKCHIEFKQYSTYEECMDSQKLDWIQGNRGRWYKPDSPVENKNSNCILIQGKSYLPESGVIK